MYTAVPARGPCYARSRSLPNAPIAHTIIWIRSCKLCFSSAAAAGRRLVSLAGRAAAPSAGLASPWATSGSGGVGASSAGRASFPPAAGAGAACGGGGSGCAVAVLANSVPRLTRRLPVSRRLKNHNIILSAFVTSRWLPQKPSNYSKRCNSGILHNVLCRGSMLWLPEVTCCCQIHSRMNKSCLLYTSDAADE